MGMDIESLGIKLFYKEPNMASLATGNSID